MKVDDGILTSAAALITKVANNTSEMVKRIDQVYQDALDHFFPFKNVFRVKTGSESSWLKTR